MEYTAQLRLLGTKGVGIIGIGCRSDRLLELPQDTPHAAEEAERPFDALIAFNDGLALGALRALASAGVRVPDDVAVTGFDNLEASRYSFPSLTTVSPRLSAYADDAVDLLAARIEDAGAPARTLVEGVALLPRDSTIGGDAPWRPR